MCTETDTEARAKLAAELELGLAHCTGGDEIYRHWLGVQYTEGVQYLAEKANAFWLIDAIASYQPSPRVRKSERLQEFQFWELKVNLAEHTSVLTCREDSDEKPVITQRIEYTDFPLASIKLYVEDRVILLPSEH
jgi:hypothetical protein